MTHAGSSISAIQPGAAYEALRAAVLGGHSSGQYGLAIIIHRGLTAWLGEMKTSAPPATPSAVTSRRSIGSIPPASTPNELTRVLAGIIVALTTEDASAHA